MIEEWLLSGCDERIDIKPDNQANKYHLHPMKFENLLMRGSCTCGTLTTFSLQSALQFERDYLPTQDATWLQRQTERIQQLFDGDEGNNTFDVFYGPSGSDLMYWPLIMQAVLRPNQQIINIVSCPEELGSGSVLAAEGKFYAHKNQFGDPVAYQQVIAPNMSIQVHYLPAREANGHIANRKQVIRDLIHQHEQKPLVVNLVFGSKSGIKDDLEIIDEFPHIMWVVDLCQLRVNKSLIHELLQKNVILMVTGSKFYQAPPFCGALLVPKLWTHQLMGLPAHHLSDYGKIFSAYDAPSCLNIFENIWPSKINIGLRLRWHIALDEIEAYYQIPVEESEKVIEDWWLTVSERLSGSAFFELMPDTQLTNNSIISFSVKNKNKELDFSELKMLFDKLVLSSHTAIDGFEKVFLGQPVNYGKRSFIRLALGSHSIRMLHQIKENPYKSDLQLIDQIEETVQKLFPI